MAVITFLVVLLLIAAVVGGVLFGGQYLAYRRDARLSELKEKDKELRIYKKALNVGRSALQQVGNNYAHNPQLNALHALDEINELVASDDAN